MPRTPRQEVLVGCIGDVGEIGRWEDFDRRRVPSCEVAQQSLLPIMSLMHIYHERALNLDLTQNSRR